ncbi:hypothetical protein HMN09_00937300 [Mycena chlorophos]|uniref:Glycosyltransferase 61 catalytic domain-containing protein n=1 Tax=Mycena chlorophos TaxID=658473 RepID=A0A8H6W3N3_MYCCL|nr:hypothetical protein HMN09_00937300 [Mycena chlorophos]
MGRFSPFRGGHSGHWHTRKLFLWLSALGIGMLVLYHWSGAIGGPGTQSGGGNSGWLALDFDRLAKLETPFSKNKNNKLGHEPPAVGSADAKGNDALDDDIDSLEDGASRTQTHEPPHSEDWAESVVDGDETPAVWPYTRIPNKAHVHGFTVLENIYLRDGTFFVYRDPATETFPAARELLAKPVDKEHNVNDEPTEEELRFLSSEEEMRSVLGETRPMRVEGTSVVVYDTKQFMTHFYHWFGEIILGFWRVYSHLLLNDSGETPLTSLPPARRFIIPFVPSELWRDKPDVDGPLMRAAFPGASIETATYWNDFKRLGTTVLFERVVLVSRSSAHKHPFGGVWFKMIAGAMNVTAPEDYWRPIRENVWESFWGVRGTADSSAESVSPVDSGLGTTRLPVVTYVSRQGQENGRRLTHPDHEALVVALDALAAEGECEVRVVQMEKLTLREQVGLMRDTTILIGVHGNGLTVSLVAVYLRNVELTAAIKHQLWMQPSPHSTVIEILIPQGYVFDYEMLARNMGHKVGSTYGSTDLAYAGAYSTMPYGTTPTLPSKKAPTTRRGVNYPDGFHKNVIPVYGPTIVEIIRTRLGLRSGPEQDANFSG